MANQEQLEILKQGFKVWNNWRFQNLDIETDLRGVDLKNFDFTRFNLSNVSLGGSDLRGANFGNANLGGVELNGAKLNKAILRNMNLTSTKLIGADLGEADISGSEVSGADCTEAKLGGAKLIGSHLWKVNLTAANLWETDFTDANIGADIFVSIDLSNTKGLESINHESPSSLGTDTLILSKGKIPETFLRGCGLSDWEIEAAKLYDPNLTNQEMDEILYRVHDIRAHQPIQIAPLFISYSHIDSVFVDRMEKSLDKRGIRFWRDIHHFTSGPLEKQIDRAISQNPTVLVVLSENSTKSDWVQHEVRKAREIEKDIGRHVLCPLRLDDTFFSSPWPERIKEQVMEYNILDFSEWEDNDKFEKMFTRLIDGLNIFYKKEEE